MLQHAKLRGVFLIKKQLHGWGLTIDSIFQMVFWVKDNQFSLSSVTKIILQKLLKKTNNMLFEIEGEDEKNLVNLQILFQKQRQITLLAILLNNFSYRSSPYLSKSKTSEKIIFEASGGITKEKTLNNGRNQVLYYFTRFTYSLSKAGRYLSRSDTIKRCVAFLHFIRGCFMGNRTIFVKKGLSTTSRF